MLHFIITTLDSSTLCLDSNSHDISTTSDLYDVVTLHTNIPSSHYKLIDNNDHHSLIYSDSNGKSELLSLHYPCLDNFNFDDHDHDEDLDVNNNNNNNNSVDDMTPDRVSIIFLQMTIPIMGGIDFQHREGSKIGSGIVMVPYGLHSPTSYLYYYYYSYYYS